MALKDTVRPSRSLRRIALLALAIGLAGALFFSLWFAPEERGVSSSVSPGSSNRPGAAEPTPIGTPGEERKPLAARKVERASPVVDLGPLVLSDGGPVLRQVIGLAANAEPRVIDLVDSRLPQTLPGITHLSAKGHSSIILDPFQEVLLLSPVNLLRIEGPLAPQHATSVRFPSSKDVEEACWGPTRENDAFAVAFGNAMSLDGICRFEIHFRNGGSIHAEVRGLSSCRASIGMPGVLTQEISLVPCRIRLSSPVRQDLNGCPVSIREALHSGKRTYSTFPWGDIAVFGPRYSHKFEFHGPVADLLLPPRELYATVSSEEHEVWGRLEFLPHPGQEYTVALNPVQEGWGTVSTISGGELPASGLLSFQHFGGGGGWIPADQEVRIQDDGRFSFSAAPQAEPFLRWSGDPSERWKASLSCPSYPPQTKKFQVPLLQQLDLGAFTLEEWAGKTRIESIHPYDSSFFLHGRFKSTEQKLPVWDIQEDGPDRFTLFTEVPIALPTLSTGRVLFQPADGSLALVFEGRQDDILHEIPLRAHRVMIEGPNISPDRLVEAYWEAPGLPPVLVFRATGEHILSRIGRTQVSISPDPSQEFRAPQGAVLRWRMFRDRDSGETLATEVMPLVEELVQIVIP